MALQSPEVWSTLQTKPNCNTQPLQTRILSAGIQTLRNKQKETSFSTCILHVNNPLYFRPIVLGGSCYPSPWDIAPKWLKSNQVQHWQEYTHREHFPSHKAAGKGNQWARSYYITALPMPTAVTSNLCEGNLTCDCPDKTHGGSLDVTSSLPSSAFICFIIFYYYMFFIYIFYDYYILHNAEGTQE